MVSRRYWRILLAGVCLLALVPVAPLSAQTADPAELDPESPLAPMADIGVAWPEMSQSPGDAATPAAPDTPDERRYRTQIVGLGEGERDDIVRQFETLSTLKEGEGKVANAAQIDRRAREDADLLSELLRSKGYYDALVETEVDSSGEAIAVRLIAEPGPLYRFATVEVAGLAETGAKADELRAAFAVSDNDPVDAAQVLGGEAAVTAQIKAEGFPFAKISESDVVVDHETRTATLRLQVDPGGERRIGRFIVNGRRPPFGARHVATIARFKPGELYNQEMIDDLKRALVATGLMSSAGVKPVPGESAALADIEVTLDRGPQRTIAAEIGYGTGEGFRIEGSWTHRNLISPEGAVTFRGVLGTQEQYLGTVLRQSNFRKRDRILNARIFAANINRDAFDARTFEVGANIERVSTIIWQKKWTWSAGFELLASDERDASRLLGDERRTFFIGALPFALGYDGSDDLLDPTRGFRLGGRVTPEASLQSGTAFYARAQVEGSAYLPAGKNIVVAGRAKIGTIAGAGQFSIAPSRRFYAGGGGSIRGYGFQMVGPRDALNDPTGGRSVVEFGLEARIRFGDFGVVPFIDGGNVFSGSTPELSGFRYGAGVGARYHSSFGPIRIDLGTPLNPRPGDTRITVYVSLGQAF